MSKKSIIALLGTPNSGKSSIFNHLTGLRQKVGNYSGVTVDKKYGEIKSAGQSATLIDLPGTHSLYAVSEDERVVVRTLLDISDENHPDAILYVADASNLSRSLLMLTQLCDLGYPIVCCLNMRDVALNNAVSIDVQRLENVLGVPVVPVSGRSGEGLEEAVGILLRDMPSRSGTFVTERHYKWKEATALQAERGSESVYAAYLMACQYRNLDFVNRQLSEGLEAQLSVLSHIKAEVEDKKERIGLLQTLLIGVEKRNGDGAPTLSQRWDRWLTHPVYGTIIFFIVLFVLFQAIFSWAGPAMDWIDGGVAALSGYLRSVLPATALTDLLIDGVLAGIGGVIIFIPQIALLFGLVSLLEESGYMARAVFLSDKVMNRTGLNGRSLVSLISGVACAVPAIMAARTIGNWKERLITIFVTPFMSCSARLPVYIVLVAFVVDDGNVMGVVSKKGLVMFGLYLIGAFTAIAAAWVMSRAMKSKEASFLMLELPQYQWPQLRNVSLIVFEKTKLFVVEAGKVILLISIILWALASYGPSDQMDMAEQQARAVSVERGLAPQASEDLVAAKRLEASYIGHFGKAIEPVIAPIGFDWKMGIAVITSFAAREVFVGTMATIYSTGSAVEEATIIERMRNEKDELGRPVYTPVRSLSLLLFYVFALQCMSTLAVVKRETKSWTIPILQFVVMTGIAYLVSLGVWQIWGA